jgi:hypothetical protein
MRTIRSRGFDETPLTTGVVDSDGTRCTGPEIEAYLKTLH